MIGQGGSEFKVESDIVIMLPVRAVRCPHKPHSVSDRSDWSEAARDPKRTSVVPRKFVMLGDIKDCWPPEADSFAATNVYFMG